jgi:hypothetical protein
MAFELFCATMIAILFGLALVLSGYRFFMWLLPIWGFFFGFGLGAQSIQYLFGTALLADVTSWIVGFVVGVIFAVLSYAIYIFGVALLAGSIGYGLGVLIMLWIGVAPGFLTWLVGIILGAALMIVTIYFNLQRYVVTIGTAVIGAGIIVGTFVIGPVGMGLVKFMENPIQRMLENSPVWAVIFLALVIGGSYMQLKVKQAVPVDYMTPDAS